MLQIIPLKLNDICFKLGMLLLLPFSLCSTAFSQNVLYFEDFEGNEPGWYTYTACTGGCPNGGPTPPNTATTDATDEVYKGSEALKASLGEGACGTSGVAYNFDFTLQPDSIVLYLNYEQDAFGNNEVVIKDDDSTNHNVVFSKNPGGTSLNEPYRRLSFDVSDYSKDFTLIIGNKDESSRFCNFGDHGWTTRADNITVYGASPTPPVANFTVPDTVTVNTTTCIDNLSQNAASINWYVDGVNRGSSDPLKYTPTATGNHTISLAVSNTKGSDSISKQVYVKQQRTPVANFTASQNIVDPTTTIQFKDLSKNGPTEWDWSFSPNVLSNVVFTNGSGASCLGIANSDSAKNPEAQFLLPGTYDVTLIVSNQLGKDTLTKKDYIIVRQEPKNICVASQGTADYGSIVDDGGEDNDYTNNRSCNFTLNTCKRTILQVEEFDLASGDYLRVYDGKNANGKPLWDTAKFGSDGLTGSKSNVSARLVAESGYVYVEFETDNSDVGSGFKLNWSTQPLQNVQAPTPSITGPANACPKTETAYQVANPEDGTTYTWDTMGLNMEGEAAKGRKADLQFPYSGNWDLTLTAANCVDTVSVTKSVTVGGSSSAPNAGFDADNRQPVKGEAVSFQDSATTCTDYYKWEFDKRVNYVSGSQNSAEPKVEFLEEGCYEVTLSVGNSVDTVTKTKSCFIDVKCIPTVLNQRQDLGINDFRFATINNSTKSGESGFSSYYNQSDLTANVERGGTYKLSVSRNTSFNAQDLKVWLDINGDNEFSSSNEVLLKEKQMGQSFTAMVTIPDTTSIGDLRLRVGVNLSGEPIKVCGINRFGEFEDYRVSVTPDQTPPEITLNGPDTVMLGACQDPSVVDTGVSAVDAIQGPVSTINRTILVDSSTAGIDSIVYTASDGVGNTAEATRYVRVEKDQAAPQVTLPGPDTVQTVVFSSYNDPSSPNVSDQCSGIDSVRVISNVDSSKLGTYRYSYEVSDEAGNTSTVSRTVLVADTTSPDFTLAGNDPQRIRLGGDYREAGIGSLSDNYWDEEDLETMIANDAVVTSRVDTFRVTYTVTDGSGNTATKQRQVIVEDKIAPEVTAQLDGRELDNGDTVTVPVNEVTDLRSRVTVTDNSRFGVTVERSGSYFSILDNQGRPSSLGIYDAKWTFSDASGNASSLNLAIEVVDNEAPELTLKPEDRTITIGAWDTTIYEAFDSAVAVSDNHYIKEKEVDTTSTYFSEFLVQRPGPSDPGIYVIRYTATDSAGNTASAELRFDARVTGIENEGQEAVELTVYPNPTNGRLTIDLDQRVEQGTMRIVDVNGREVQEVNGGNQLMPGTYQVNLKNQSDGVYFLKLNTGSKVITERFVIAQ
jgi:PKD repeat protein